MAKINAKARIIIKGEDDTVRRKQTAILLLSVFCLAVFVGCSGTRPDDTQVTQAPSDAPVITGADFDNRFGQGYSNLAETDDAYYFRGFNSGFLYYFDKASGESAVLCGKPECLHDPDDCNAYIGKIGRSLNLYDGRLYFVSPDSSNNKLGYYSIALDGTDRKLETHLDDEQSMMCYDLHRGMLYGWRNYEKVADGIPVNAIDIRRFDPKTGESKTLLSVETTEACSQPSIFFYGKYVYYCYNTEIYDIDPKTDEISNHRGTLYVGRIDTETLESELLFEQTKEMGFGSEFRLWVEGEDRIFLVPALSAVNEESVNVYLLSGGELSIAHTFSGMGSAYPIEGAAVKIYPSGSHAEIWGFDGTEICNGDWQTEFENADGEKYIVSAVDTAYGDLTTLFVVYSVKIDGQPRSQGLTTCLVRYDLTAGELKPELLMICPNS